MMLPLCLAIGLQHQQIENLPYKAAEMLFPGEREVVLGPLPYPDTVMPIYHSKETHPAKPSNVFGGPMWDEYSLGTLRWSVRKDNYGQKPCMVIVEEGTSTPQKTYTFNKFRKVTVTIPIKGSQEWWLDADGTILRQFVRVADTRGIQTAACTYDKESINVQLDQFGKRSVTTLYPADMDKLQLQFKPMIVGGKVVMADKDYLMFDPFKGGFAKFKAHVGGHFDGKFIGIQFHGIHVDMDGIVPDGPAIVYVDDENDLVQIDLPNDNFVLLGGTPPPGKQK